MNALNIPVAPALKRQAKRAPAKQGNVIATIWSAKPTPLRVAAFLAAGFVGSLAFDASSISPASAKSPERRTEPASRPVSRTTHVTAGDEYDVGKGTERMLRTTREIRDIVNTLPGPGLPSSTPPAADQQRYTNAYDETIERLKHAARLVAETTSILEAMPTPSSEAPAEPESISSTPPLTQAQPAPVTISASAAAPTVQPNISEPTIAAPTITEPTRVEPPKAEGRKPPLTTMTLTRLVILILGALFALALVKYLPRMFRNGKHEQPAPIPQPVLEPIEAPPLKDPALELADIMSSMGLTDGAAHALVERIRTNPRQALSHWLKLLEVYRQAGKKAEFENAAEQVRSSFNVRPDDWGSKGIDKSEAASLESYPHIAAQLKKLWPRPECSDFLLGLLADNRAGKREGFPLSVVEEIVLLLAVLRSEEPVPA